MALTLNNFTGFETGGLEEASATTNTPAVISSGAMTDSYVLSMSTSAAHAYDLGVADFVSDAGSGHICGVRVRMSDVTPSGGDVTLLSTPNDQVVVILESDGDVRVVDSAATTLFTATTPFSTFTNHYIEIYVSGWAASGITVTLFVDGTQVGTSSSANTSTTAATAWTIGYTGVGGGFNNGDTGPLFDDMYILTGATAATDRYGDFEVFGYQNTNTTSTGDGGALGNAATAAAVGTWDDVAETPLNATNELEFTATGSGGSADSAALGAEIDGDSNIKGIKGVWRLSRDNGSGTTHSVVLGDDGDGNSPAATTVSLTNAAADYFVMRVTDLPLKSTGQKIRQGAWTAGARDIHIYEQWAMLAHVGNADVTFTADVTTYTYAGPNANLNLNYTFTADVTTYTCTGPNTNFNLGYTFTADVTAYTCTGPDTGLNRSLVLPADVTAFTCTGPDAGLNYNQVFTADVTAYTFTGPNTNFNLGYVLPADVTAYTFNGPNADLDYARVFTADVTTYTFTGPDAGLERSLVLPADVTAYTFTGPDAGLKFGYTLTADVTAYTCTGPNANLNRSLVLPADVTAYTYAGPDAGLERSLVLPADVTAYTCTGPDAGLGYTRTFTADVTAYTFSGPDTNLNYISSSTFTADVTAYTFTGPDAGLERSLVLPADVTAYTFTGPDAGLDYFSGYTFTADVTAYTFSGPDTGLNRSLVLPADVTAFTCTGPDAGLERSLVLPADVTTYTFSGPDTGLNKNYHIVAGVEAFTLTPQDILVHQSRKANEADFTLGLNNVNFVVIGTANRDLEATVYVPEEHRVVYAPKQPAHLVANVPEEHRTIYLSKRK